MSWVFASESLDSSEKLVALAIADCANDDGVCWPSLAKLAKKCAMTETGICRIIERLVSDGIIAKKKRFAQSTIYSFSTQGQNCSKVDPVSTKGGKGHQPRSKRETSTETSLKRQAGPRKDKASESALYPTTCESEELPANWQDYAEAKGLSFARIFETWPRFKEHYGLPWTEERWRTWVDREYR